MDFDHKEPRHMLSVSVALDDLGSIPGAGKYTVTQMTCRPSFGGWLKKPKEVDKCSSASLTFSYVVVLVHLR